MIQYLKGIVTLSVSSKYLCMFLHLIINILNMFLFTAIPTSVRPGATATRGNGKGSAPEMSQSQKRKVLCNFYI